MLPLTSVIIVDNDQTSLSISAIVLKQFPSIRYCQFTNAEEALCYLKSEHLDNTMPTILLLDLSMPVMNGWQMLDEWKKTNVHNSKTIFVFIFSASLNKADKEKSRQYEFVVDFIEKPLTLSKLKFILSEFNQNGPAS